MLDAGFRPPLAEGFDRFVRSGAVSALISAHLEQELKDGKADPYDTHPPLKERIAAVAALPPGDTAADDPPAIALLEGEPELENELLAALAGEEVAQKLKPVGWSEVRAKVYRPQWSRLVHANAAALRGLTPESLPAAAANLKAFRARFVYASGEKPTAADEEHLGSAVVGAALLLALEQRGGLVEKEPSKPFAVRLNSEVVEPFGLMDSLVAGKLSAEEWRAQCTRLGLAGLDLATVAAPPPPPPPGTERSD